MPIIECLSATNCQVTTKSIQTTASGEILPDPAECLTSAIWAITAVLDIKGPIPIPARVLTVQIRVCPFTSTKEHTGWSSPDIPSVSDWPVRLASDA